GPTGGSSGLLSDAELAVCLGQDPGVVSVRGAEAQRVVSVLAAVVHVEAEGHGAERAVDRRVGAGDDERVESSGVVVAAVALEPDAALELAVAPGLDIELRLDASLPLRAPLDLALRARGRRDHD